MFFTHWTAALTRRGRLAVLLVAACVVATAGAANDAPVTVDVLAGDPGRIVLQYQFDDPAFTTVKIDDAPYTTVQLGREAALLAAGAPDLVQVNRSVIIPDDAEMTVKVVSAQFYEVALRLAPSKGNLLRTVNPADVPYAFGPEYAVDAFYPGPLAALGEPYILRDYRGVVVHAYPLQYNPVRETLRVYTSLTLEVVAVGPGQTNVLVRDNPARQVTPTFDQLYARQFLNYGDLKAYPPMNEEGELLIIVHDAWNANIQPLAAHKAFAGIPTTVVNVSSIGNNATSIRNYIQNRYNQGNLAFVLLVGDSAQVATPSASGGAADPTYAKLAGNDYYPDIIVGRFSAETAAQVDTQVERTVAYETLAATQQPWFKRATGIASNQGPGDNNEYDNQHLNVIRTKLLAYGYTLVDQIYDPTATVSAVASALNAGRGLVNYTGHGSRTSWSSSGFSSSNITALTNAGMLPVIFSVACVNGEFAGYTCFAETWLRSTSGGQPIGAAAVYMSSINQSWNPPMAAQDEFADLLIAEAYDTFGGLCYAASGRMIEKYGADGADMFNTWHIFGDPSLRVVGTIAPPAGIRVTPGGDFRPVGDTGGPFSPGSTVYTIENRGETPLDFVVTRDVPWLSLTTTGGTLAPGATVDVTATINHLAAFLGTGEHLGTLTFTNLTDGIGDTARKAVLQVGVPSVQYAWYLDTNPGWNTQGLWAWGRPTGGGGQYSENDPTAGRTGLNVYGYNLSGDYENSLPERHLTSTAIDCSEMVNTSLRFWRWLGVEQPTYDRASVRVSRDGLTWTTIWQNQSQIADTSWQYQEFDISAVADGQPAVYLRWTMGTTDSSWQFCGWNIDDIEVWGLVPSGPLFLPGDLNCDGAIDTADIDPFVQALVDPAGYAAAYPACDAALADTNGDDQVDTADIDAFVALIVGG
ncbi:MAG: hypothetical protein GX591_00415 [Planctomycetes bacterium]|nr:hypothetical protein [Planctomycetota bacterium]